MKIERANYSPGALLEFYEESLTALGALCDRTWHDRMDIVAEGRAATLWNPDGALHAVELHFAPADAASARDAAKEVFPGCPLTFRLAEASRLTPVPLERFVLADGASSRPPDPGVAEKLWRAQFPETRRWEMAEPFKPDFHFSILVLARCEIQAIDQRWILCRTAVSLPGGEIDQHLANEAGFSPVGGGSPDELKWPAANPALWSALLQQALAVELEEELALVRSRQENSLRRELERIDDYFENYEIELSARAARHADRAVVIKTKDRLAAAQAEHFRRRADQVTRHEIRVHPHLDALLLVGERAWRAPLRVDRARHTEVVEARLVPRSRRWEIGG